MRRLLRSLFAPAAAAALVACGPTYQMAVPEGFKKYEDGSDFKMITADGVLLKAREVDNEPVATLPFWVDAMKRHLTARGYVFEHEQCFETQRRLPGCRLDFLLPHGAEDWVLSETVFVVGDRVVLVEAAGPYERFSKVRPALEAALTTFDPGD